LQKLLIIIKKAILLYHRNTFELIFKMKKLKRAEVQNNFCTINQEEPSAPLD